MRALIFVAFFLISAHVFADGGLTLSGVVEDPSGSQISEATVEIRNGAGLLLGATRVDDQGQFTLSGLPAGPVRLRVNSRGFSAGEQLLYLDSETRPVRITLDPEAMHTRITVNATRGGAEEIQASPHIAIVRDATDILKRPVPTIGNILEGEPGIFVQQSTYAQVSPFLRGLTGYQVLNVVDGIRFNNSTFRSGPNQYLAFIEPTQAQRVEVLLGPTGSQYGSDSLGGTIQVLTEDPQFTEPRQVTAHGDFLVSGASADLSGAGSGRVSLANDKLYWLIGASGRHHNDLRAGRGFDSRNVYHRLFGLPQDDVENLLGSRQQDTGFRQYGLQTKFAASLAHNQLLTLYYQRNVQENVRGYKDLLGGLGRVLSSFEPQILNWTYGRYEKLGVGFLDSLSATWSLNQQVDGGSRQNLRFSDPITRDHNRVNAYGYTTQATVHRGTRLLASFGGEVYDERVASNRTVVNPATGGVSNPRPLYPDGSLYQSMGLFGQSSYEVSRQLRVGGGMRLTGVRFKARPDASLNIPGGSQWFRDVTFHSTVSWSVSQTVAFHGLVSRGFRAPNLNDLGALGLNDLGYEIPVSEAIGAGALLSTDSGETAISKGIAAQPLAAESLMNYEAGMRVMTQRLYARAQFFDADLYDPIVRRTLLFPAGSVPLELAGLPVSAIPQTSAQREQNVVAVATQLDPRAVKAFVNDGRSRYYGVETLARYRIAPRLSIEGNYSYIVGRDLNPNRNIRRLPPQMAAATLRYTPSGRRAWYEVALMAAGKQSRLSGGDRDDERIGASFRRRDIADFFQGSRVSPYVSGGVFEPTGETLLQIQNRVLPVGSNVNGVTVVDDNSRVPLYLSTAGWLTLNIRSGIPVGERWMAIAALENVLDRNYRFHGSGMDAPGISAYLALMFRF